MAQNGTLFVRTFVSRAQLPVADATVIVSEPASDGRQKLLAIRKTDESGVAGPIVLESPERSESLTPDHNGDPFSSYTLVVEHPDYLLEVYENLQIFPGVETVQDVALKPIAVDGRDKSDLTSVTPQPL